MKRCIQIGKNGLGTTAPNPMVGCVIVYDQYIIGEGFTSPYGGAHAEINAINSVKDQSLLSQSTLYVTLEPCSHFGKTPPCADAIIQFKIPKVVIGCKDTHSKVAGRGIERLKTAGCDVVVGVLEDEVKIHHKRFFTFHNKQRPFIILKWAESADAYLAPKTRNEQKPVWITNRHSRQLVHKWRTEEQAILVGTTTVLDDNPSLTARNWIGRNPIRIILDQNLRILPQARVFDTQAKTILISKDHQKLPALPHLVELTTFNWESKNTIARQICTILHNQDISSVIIEGGSRTLQTFIDENLWDEARVFTGSNSFKEGTRAPQLSGTLTSQKIIYNDILRIYTND